MKKLIQSFKPRTKEEKILCMAAAVYIIYTTILLILPISVIEYKPVSVTYIIITLITEIAGINAILHEYKFSSIQSRKSRNKKTN